MIRIELAEIMQAQGLTQRELAEKAGVRQARISQICNGYVDRLELDHINAICNALNVSPWAWIIYTPDNNEIA